MRLAHTLIALRSCLSVGNQPSMRWLVGLATDRRVLAGVLVLGGAGSAVYVTYRAFRRAWNHECEEREAAQASSQCRGFFP